MNSIEEKKQILELKVLGSRQTVGGEIGEAGDLVIRANGGTPELLSPEELCMYRDMYHASINPSHMALDTWVMVIPR